jgi:DNA polymerase
VTPVGVGNQIAISEPDASSSNRERARVRPAMIVTLGATALGAITGRKIDLREAIEAPIRIGEAWIVATYSPPYALRVTDVATRDDIVARNEAAISRAQQLVGQEPADASGQHLGPLRS